MYAQGVVKCVEPDSLTLTDNTVMPFGLCIWSTGVGPTPFTLSLPFAKTKVGRIAVGEWHCSLINRDTAFTSYRVRGLTVYKVTQGRMSLIAAAHVLRQGVK
jgi:hypothetical protein